MEPSAATSSSFRFRDHLDSADDSTESDTSSLDESELESMTGKGIKRLLMELVEIKAASDEDFHRNIFANYAAFVGIFEEVKNMEKEAMLLQNHISTQRKLVRDLIDSVYLKDLFEDTIELEVSEFDEPPSPNGLEARMIDVSETLDVLMSENRIDEAIAIIEMEEENLETVQHEDNTLLGVLILYRNAISERKTVLKLHLTLMVENSRIASTDLQRALVGLRRLGDYDLATQLLLKHYHSRLATGINNLQSSKSFIHGMYVGELSKFVFSMISQAARSYVMLYGENTPYASEFIQWVHEEIEGFAVSFTKYVKSISETSNGLSVAVEAVQFVMSYCSLLESQRLVLWPCLIKHVRPCMEEVLQIHIDHFKKVIAFFTTIDAWVLGRYLRSGIMDGNYSSVVVGQQSEYCLLTNSGRKFVTLLQAITKDVTPLVSLQMDGCILRGLMNLHMEYVAILERAIGPGTNMLDQNGSKIILAESMPQQVSILANLSTLEYFFSSNIISIFGDINHISSELLKDHSVVVQQQELDAYVLFIQKASDRLRDIFYQQFICKVMSLETGLKLTLEACTDNGDGSGTVDSVMPSVAFQVVFLELRKLDKLVQDKLLDAAWLMELIRGLIEAMFLWVFDNKRIWETNEETFIIQHSDIFNQFVLDMYFLVEIARYGEYFPEEPLLPESLMKSVFTSAGLDRNFEHGEWAIKAATKAIQKLLHIEETKSLETHSEHASETFQDDDKSSSEGSQMSKDSMVTMDAVGAALNSERMRENADTSHLGRSLDLLEDEDRSVDRTAACLTDISENLEDIESENAAYDKFHFVQETSLSHLLVSAGIGEASEGGFPAASQASSWLDESEFIVNQLEDDAETELPESQIASPEDSAVPQGRD